MFNRLLNNFLLNLSNVNNQLLLLKTGLRAEGYPLPTHDVAVRPSYFRGFIHAGDLIGRRSAHGSFLLAKPLPVIKQCHRID